MSNYMLETKCLTKKFKNQNAVNSVSMRVPKQTVYGLLGPNGAGKSTLLKMITGILRPSSGEIYIGGRPWSRKELANIGALIEAPALYENLTAWENLKVRTLLLDLPDSRIREVLRQVDLEKTGKKKAGQFSLGMKQRLGIAAALLNHPQLLILDEPTNGLDPFGIQEMRSLIRGFADSGMTVIVSSHILSEVEQVADYIGIICDGVLGYQGVMEESEDLEELFVKVAAKQRKAGESR